MTTLEALEKWREQDKRNVDEFNSEFAWRNPPLEVQVEFLRFRLQTTMGAMSHILELLIQERSTEGKSDCRCVRDDGTTKFNINCAVHGKAP